MKKRTAFIGAILSLIPLGQPLFIKTGVFLSTIGISIFHTEQTFANTFQYYFDKCLEEQTSGDYYDAIVQCDKAIKLLSGSGNTGAALYHNRGRAKLKLGLLKESILDFDTSIAINPNLSVNVYSNRGIAKAKLNDFYGAISDYTIGLKLDPNSNKTYLNRSIAKEKIGDIKGACSDAKQAVLLGNSALTNKNWINVNC